MTLILKALQRIELALPPLTPPASADDSVQPSVPEEVDVLGPDVVEQVERVEQAIADELSRESEIVVEASDEEPCEAPVEVAPVDILPGPWMVDGRNEPSDQQPGEPSIADLQPAVEEQGTTEAETSRLPGVDLQFRELANQMVAQMEHLGHAAVMITSPGGCLAQSAFVGPLGAALHQQLGGQVLVVDANVRQPALAGWFGVWSERGLADVMAGQVAWTDLVQRTSLPGVCLLPGRQGEQILAGYSPEFGWGSLLEELKDRYCWILFDAPPPEDPLAQQLAPHCDATYLFLRLHHTSRRASRHAVNLLENCGARVLGSVVVTQ